MTSYDVAVVGGGAIGGEVAKLIASKDIEVTILEEHEKIGTPLQCAGLVTPKVLEGIESPPPSIIQNHIHGAPIFRRNSFS